MAKTPISDLSYRGYQGGLSSTKSRWLVIARHTWKQSFKNKWYWWLTILGGAHYLILAATAFFIENLGPAGGGQIKEQFFASQVWRDQFLHGFALGHYMLMAVVLIVGAGVIANDNQSRALLVYLSKPCSKFDYLAGKWFGVFVPIAMTLGIPALFFLLYGAMNYRQYGFLTEDKLLFLKVPLVIALASAFLSSLIIGFSAMFKQGRVAGSTYAGLYVISGLFGTLIGGIAMRSGLPESASEMLSRLHYFSIYGVVEGLYKLILNTDGTRMFGDRAVEMVFARPPILLEVFLYLIPAGISLLIAWSRIKAVEVVG